MEAYKIAHLRDLWQRFENADARKVDKATKYDWACILAGRVGMLLEEIESLQAKNAELD